MEDKNLFAEGELYSRIVPRIFTTRANDPTEGRTFVWTHMGWYERMEGETGAVAFSPVAQDESELREWLSLQTVGDLTEIDDNFAGQVREEFLNQTPLYPEAPELSNQQT